MTAIELPRVAQEEVESLEAQEVWMARVGRKVILVGRLVVRSVATQALVVEAGMVTGGCSRWGSWFAHLADSACCNRQSFRNS